MILSLYEILCPEAGYNLSLYGVLQYPPKNTTRMSRRLYSLNSLHRGTVIGVVQGDARS